MQNIIFNNELQIANYALTRLGIDAIQNMSLNYNGTQATDVRQERLIHVLPLIVNSFLEKHYWQFAIKTAKLTPYSDGGFVIPSDHLRLVGIGLHDCCDPCALNESSSTGTKNGEDLVTTTNNYLKSQNSDRYLSTVSFRIVNNRFFYHVINPETCNDVCPEYDTLFYIHSNINEMKMTNNFIRACAYMVASELTSTAKHDPQDIMSNQNAKAGMRLLYEEIKREYNEFKYNFKFNKRQKAVKSRRSGFTISPFERF